MRKLVFFLYHSNVLIATGAAALVGQAQLTAQLQPVQFNLIAWAFLACFTFYNLHDGYTKVWHTLSPSTLRKQFWLRYWPVLFPANLLLAGFCAWYFPLHITPFQWLVVAIASLLSLAYSFPVLPFNTLKRWKNHGLYKVVILTFVWSFFCTAFAFTHWTQLNGQILALWFIRFIMLLMISLPFDVRDELADSQYMKRTITHVWSAKKLQHITLVLALAGMAMLLPWLYQIHINGWMMWLCTAHWVAMAYWSVKALQHTSQPLRFVWLDAQLLLHPTFLGIGLLDTYIRST